MCRKFYYHVVLSDHVICRKFYYHVVLGLVYRGKFGTLGLSRRNNLMDKPLHFTSLNDLVQVTTIEEL